MLKHVPACLSILKHAEARLEACVSVEHAPARGAFHYEILSKFSGSNENLFILFYIYEILSRTFRA